MTDPADRLETEKEAMRETIWAALRTVARPDSRFHWNFAEFITDYEGSEEGAERIRQLPEWQAARLVFITPDNNLEPLRRKAMEDGKPYVMSTYGIARGFLYLDPATVAPEQRGWAASLDGMERFGQPVGLRDLAALGRIQVLVTGGSAISIHGLRSGKGHGYFDLEWAMFSEVGCLTEQPLVIAAGHDCQVVDSDLPASEFDTRADLIVTPTRTIPVAVEKGHRPGKILWDKLQPGMEARIPPLQELRAMIEPRIG